MNRCSKLPQIAGHGLLLACYPVEGNEHEYFLCLSPETQFSLSTISLGNEVGALLSEKLI